MGESNQYKEIFSNFPIVIRGENRIDIMPPDVNQQSVIGRDMR